MKRKLLIILLILIFVILSFILILQLDAVSRQIFIWVANNNNYEIELEDWSYDIFSNRIYIKEIKFKPDNDTQNSNRIISGKISKVVGYLNPLAMLSRNIDLNDIYIEGAEINYKKIFVLQEKGKPEEPEKPSKPLTFSMKNVNITNSFINYVDSEDLKDPKSLMLNINIKNGNYNPLFPLSALLENDKMNITASSSKYGEVRAENSNQGMLVSQLKLNLDSANLSPIKSGNIEVFFKILKIKDSIEFYVDITPNNLELVNKNEYKGNSISHLTNISIYDLLQSLILKGQSNVSFKISTQELNNQSPTMTLFLIATKLVYSLKEQL